MRNVIALHTSSAYPELRSHEITLSFVRGVRDSCPTHATVTLGALEEHFKTPDLERGTLGLQEYLALDKKNCDQKKLRDREKDGAAFIPAKFKVEGSRLANDVALLYGFVLDFDGTATYESVARHFDGVCHFAYTSYSHGPDEPRWRIFIPYKSAVTPEYHHRVWVYFDNLMPGQLDERSKTFNQIWYTPACPHDAGEYFQSFFVEGDLFDPTALPAEEEAACRPEAPSAPLANLHAALRHIPADDRDTWIRVGMGLKAEFGDNALNTWLEWSQSSDKYDEADAHYTWRSFKPREKGITVGTVYYLAIQHGWQPPTDERNRAAIAKLNETYFVAREGGKTLVFQENTDPETGSFRLERLSAQDFRQYFSNHPILTPGQKRPLALGQYWLGHPERRQYQEVIFQPGGDHPDCYNLWRGFAVAPVAGSWTLMRQHIRDVICSGNEALFQYVLGWMAFAVQHPERPAETALVLRGERGTGKGMFLNHLGYLFGPHFTHITAARHLVGNFNSHLRHTVLLFVDEAFWAGDKQGENVLKSMITEPTILIEPKGVNPFSVKNRLHIAMASNNDWVIPAGAMERRFVVMDVSNRRIQDHQYFAAIKEEMNNGGHAAMLHDLLAYDLSTFNIRRIPKTNALRDQLLHTLPIGERWWYEELESGELWSKVSGEQTASIPRKLLFVRYCMANPNQRSERSNQTQLGMLLSKLLPQEGGGSSQTEYIIPPLKKCRLHFERLQGCSGLFPDGP